MKKSQIIKLILFPIILAGCVVSLDLFLFRKVSDDLTSYGQFYKEQEQALDVVLVGNSTLREGYVPTALWKEYEIASRGFSSSPTHPEVISVAIDEIVKKQNPKVIFIDVNGLTFQEEQNSEFFIKQYYKALPDGEHKNALREKYPYLKDDDGFELFDNHNNFRQQQYWESLVYPTQFKTKGYQPNQIVTKVNKVDVDRSKELPLTKDGEHYFELIKSACDKYAGSIQFIFGKMPKYNDVLGADKFLESEYMFKTIENKLQGSNIKFMNFTSRAEEMGLDPTKDFKDNDHLNHLGALKFTHFFGNYLLNEVKLVKKDKDESVKNNFNEAYEKTKEYLDGIEAKLRKKVGE